TDAARRPRSPTPAHVPLPYAMRRIINFPEIGMTSLHSSPSFEIITNADAAPTVTGSPPTATNIPLPNATPPNFNLYFPSLEVVFQAAPSALDESMFIPPNVPTATNFPFPNAAP